MSAFTEDQLYDNHFMFGAKTVFQAAGCNTTLSWQAFYNYHEIGYYLFRISITARHLTAINAFCGDLRNRRYIYSISPTII